MNREHFHGTGRKGPKLQTRKFRFRGMGLILVFGLVGVSLLVGVFLLGFAWWQSSWIALAFALFTFYEALMGWCIVYQLLGKNSCPIDQQKKK